MFWDQNVCFWYNYFWTLTELSFQNLGWEAMVRVDDKTYQWLGLSGTFPTQADMSDKQITPTQTIFNFSAGPAEVTATFLSPVEVTVVRYWRLSH